MSGRANADDPLIGAAGFIFQTPIDARSAPARGTAPAPSAAASARRAKAARRRALAAIRAAVAGTPEVMVKVSGAARGRRNLVEHLGYITRGGQLRAEHRDATTKDTYVVEGSDDVRQIAEEWFVRSSVGRRSDARETINLVLSMPAGTDRCAHARAAEAFAAAVFADRFDYMLVHHADTGHPHAHVTVRTRNDAGAYLNPRKADLQHWREAFAIELRRQGIRSLATPRRARGVVQKATRQAVRHLDARREATTTRRRIEQALRTLTKGAQAAPWQQALRERQSGIRQAWTTLAAALEQEGEHTLADEVRAFVAAMPAVRTREEQLVETIRANPALLGRSRDALSEPMKPSRDQERRR